MSNLFIGTSGFNYSDINKTFYPEKTKPKEMLKFYSENFNSVEINSTFYNFPRETSTQSWKDLVPENFVFSFKANQNITHNIKFKFEEEDLVSLIDSLKIFTSNNPTHVVLFQLPSTTDINYEALEKLLNFLPKTLLYAFEFRNRSWITEKVRNLLQNHNATIVLSDSPVKSDGNQLWPRVDADTANFSYLRFHGREKLYQSSYSDEFLVKCAKFIEEKLTKGINIYCYFNNNTYGFGIKNAIKLKEILNQT